ncbi:MAG TPA: hypothetical protein DGT23_27835 [Micromonosporaceae bacterium]|nr:hypothetical protein [Micromonosporaceae bacterium]
MPQTGVMPQVVFVEVVRKRRWPWVLGILGLLSVICCGVCAAITGPVWEQYPSRIAAMPQDVAGLRRDDTDVVRLVAMEAAHRIRSEQSVDDAFVAAFADPKAKDRQVIVFGATLLIWDPGAELKKAIQGAGENLSDIKPYPTGEMGGQLKCANGKDDKGKAVVICAWIDHGSMGVGVFYGARPMDESADFLRILREKIILRPGSA